MITHINILFNDIVLHQRAHHEPYQPSMMSKRHERNTAAHTEYIHIRKETYMWSGVAKNVSSSLEMPHIIRVVVFITIEIIVIIIIIPCGHHLR